MSRKLVFGTDPEAFLGKVDNEGNVFVIPPVVFRDDLGVNFIPDGRHPIFARSEEVTVMEDGAAFELTVLPSTNWEELFERVQFGYDMLKNTIASQFTDVVDNKVYTLPTINYEVEKWINRGAEFQMCTRFGCDADFDAFDSNRKAKVRNVKEHPERYAGGHIHISGSETIAKEPILTVQVLATTVGLAAIANSDVVDLDRQRTILYGKPGKYRLQHYAGRFNDIPNTEVGIEYRTPSVAWTRSKKAASEVFKWAEIAVLEILEKGIGTTIVNTFGEMAQIAIIEADQKLAVELLSGVEGSL